MVIASDGVWEFLSSEEVVNIVSKHFDVLNPKTAVEAVVSKSAREWKVRESTQDDITCVLVYFNNAMD
jgi:serine/threonine protein phosphatase PrpC